MNPANISSIVLDGDQSLTETNNSIFHFFMFSRSRTLYTQAIGNISNVRLYHLSPPGGSGAYATYTGNVELWKKELFINYTPSDIDSRMANGSFW